MILESGVKEVYQMFSTEIGLYYIDKSRQANDNDNEINFLKAFKYFERAYKIKKSFATINNYDKDIKKARDIFFRRSKTWRS